MNVDFHFHTIPRFFLDELEGDNPWGKTLETESGRLYLRTGPIRRHSRVECKRPGEAVSGDLSALAIAGRGAAQCAAAWAGA